jgi:POT family proton-dependent oligopeptide transporter
MSDPAAAGKDKKFPPQIKFIIGNEAAERYSFYGMRTILTLFMTEMLLFSDSHAQWVFHMFVFGVYFTPVIGAYISDRFWGKYRTIMTLSFVYIAGHAVLALWESTEGLYVGLALIAIGAGGIKPCVSAHVGDQFSEKNKHLIPKIFSWFYFSINFGSFFSTLLTPYTRKLWGSTVAFGIPGILMAVATLVFWMGRKYYITVPPTGKKHDSPRKVLWLVLKKGWDGARKKFGDKPVEDTRAVLRVGVLLLPICVFWALFDQTGSSWVLLTKDLNLHGVMEPDALQAANPLMVMALIPLFVGVIYPFFERRGYAVTALRKMTIGMFVTGASFAAVGMIQGVVDGGGQPSAFWMLAPYLILTAGEVLVSITGLEFAYTQAPRSVKSTVMSFWMLTVSFGNILAAFAAKLNVFEGATAFFFWGGLMTVVGVIFGLMARQYKVVEYVESEEASEAMRHEIPTARVVDE